MADLSTIIRLRLVRELSQAFQHDTRNDGSSFVKLADDSPEWMTDVIHACHAHMMPDDFRYSMIQACVDDLAEREPETWDDAIYEIADGLVDIYTGRLLAWISSRADRVAYCDEAREDGITHDDASMTDRLQHGQFMEYREILAALISEIESRADDTEATSGDFVAACEDEHMKPEVLRAGYFIVETSHGSEIVPADVIGRTCGTAAEAFANYVEGKIEDGDEVIEYREGFIARMSAPGYMDCTDWAAFETEAEAWAHLIETYGE